VAFAFVTNALPNYWHPTNASVETDEATPATGVTAIDLNSLGEQSNTPPEDGTDAIPSTWYDAGSALCVRVVPPAENTPTNAGPAGTFRL